MSDESEIRALIERWANAVHAGDMGGVVADHADDIVMFDVPPPEDGSAASTPIARRGHPSSNGSRAPPSRSSRSRSPPAPTSPSRTRCSAAGPTRSSGRTQTTVWLTIGLRKEDGRWVVAHEHHSFPDKSQP